MAVSAAKFIEQLSTVSLLASDELSALREKFDAAQLQADAEQLAKELVKSGKLTKFQASALYQGRGKGLVFGEYVVLDKIGAGGMGQVFKARHRRMKRLAAVKVLPPHVIKDPQTVHRFYQEVEMAAKLTHPNIVSAYDAAEANGLHYLVMEFVDGRDLSSLLQKQGPLNLEQVMNVIRQAAEGLDYAHSQGVVHRDIKPGNLLIDKAGVVKILDMGLARTVDALEQQDKSSKQELTQAGQVMGTVDYMAPEQARDARTADHRADIYSLGCTMYRLLTGYVPYPADTMVKKLMAHAHQPIPSLKKHFPQASPQLEDLFRRMMEKDPAQRISSAKEVAEVLKSLLRGASEEQSSVSVLDDPQQAGEWQSFLKAGSSSVSGIGKAAGSTISKGGESVVGKSGISISDISKSEINKSSASISAVVAANEPQKKLVVYGGIGAAAILLVSFGGWLALRGDAEQGPAPTNAVAAIPTPTRPAATVTAIPTASAKPVVPQSPTSAPVPTASPSPTPTATVVPTATPSATEIAFNLPATPLPFATPSSTAPLFGIDTTKPIPAGTSSADPTAAPSGTATVSTMTGTAPPPESGENFALFFDGSAHVALPRTLVLPEPRVMTWEATVQLGDAGRGACIMGNAQGNQGTSIDLGGGRIAIKMAYLLNGASSYVTKSTPLVYLPARPFRIAAVFSPKHWRLFIDGKLVLDEAAIDSPIPTSNPLLIGGEGSATRLFLGKLDEVRISSIARYVRDYKAYERLEADEHTLALYHFNEGSGTTLFDYSGNGHHGRIVNAKWEPAAPLDPRIAPPDSSTLLRVLAEVDKTIQPDLLKAKMPFDKKVLAERLLLDAGDAAKPAESRFALVQRALEIAVESGDRETIALVLDAHEKNFQGSADDRLADALTSAAKKTLSQPVWQGLATLAYDYWDRAFADDRIVLARQFADAFTVAGRKANNPALAKTAGDVTKKLGNLKLALDAAIAAQEKIVADPSDAAAHLALGEYLCFEKEDWYPGLVELALGNDDALRSLAQQTLNAGDEPLQLTAAADAWYDAAAKASAKRKPDYQSAALFLYLECYNRLTGAGRSRVEPRLTQLGAKTRSPSFTQLRREQAAAEWACSVGGQVTVLLLGSKQATTFGSRAGMPREPFLILEIRSDEVSRPQSEKQVTDAGMRCLRGLFAIHTLVLRYSRFGDAGASHLGGLTTLTYLDVNEAMFTDDAAEPLEKLVNLEYLNLRQCSNFKDDGVIRLTKTLKKLVEVNLEGRIGDLAIPHLKNWPALRRLHLPYCTQMTDTGARQLAELKQLQILGLGSIRLTPATIQFLRQALPNCQINYSPPS